MTPDNHLCNTCVRFNNGCIIEPIGNVDKCVEFEAKRIPDMPADSRVPSDKDLAKMAAALKPCPHCGKQPTIIAQILDEKRRSQIVEWSKSIGMPCDKLSKEAWESGPHCEVGCCARVEHYGGSVEASISKAITVWQRRNDSEAIVALRECFPVAEAAFWDNYSAGMCPGSGYNHKAENLASAKWGWRDDKKFKEFAKKVSILMEQSK